MDQARQSVADYQVSGTDMAVEDAIEALLEHWDDVVAQLSPRGGSRATRAGRPAPRAGPPGGGRPDHRHSRSTGCPPGIPCAGRWCGETCTRRRCSTGTRSPPTLLERAGLSAETPLPQDEDVPSRRRDPADRHRAPARGPRAVRAAGQGARNRSRRSRAHPAAPARAAVTSGPRFSSRPATGRTRSSATVNTMLHAARDPIGVADWWLSRNSWLDGRPSELLGRVPDGDLLGAARAIHSEV